MPKPNAAPPANTALSIEEVRRSIDRKLAIAAADWRRCPRRICRRRHGCVPQDVFCISPRRPKREATPEQQARAMAWLVRELKRRSGRA